DGSLAQYFTDTGEIPTSDPITPIVHWLERKPKPTGDTLTAQVNNGVFITLQRHVLVTPVEPNEVSLAFDFTDPVIATKTLQALTENFQLKVKDYAQPAATSQAKDPTEKVPSQQAQVDADRERINASPQPPPEQQRITPPFDPTFEDLKQTLSQAATALGDLK